jgi:hypothetical protein
LYKAEVFIKDPGMQMVKDQLVHVLEEFGLKEIELLGKEYDPHTAEVVGNGRVFTRAAGHMARWCGDQVWGVAEHV